jgi:hypothetical protein
MKNILIVLSFIFLSLGCYAQSFKETIIETINVKVTITKIDLSKKFTIVEGTITYKGKIIKVYNSEFEGYYKEYQLERNMVINRKVIIIKQVENNKITILGRANYKDLILVEGCGG